MSYAVSIGLAWDTTLNEDSAFWESQMRLTTGCYRTAGEYEQGDKDILVYFKNITGTYEYMNIVITTTSSGYMMTCYIG